MLSLLCKIQSFPHLWWMKISSIKFPKRWIYLNCFYANNSDTFQASIREHFLEEKKNWNKTQWLALKNEFTCLNIKFLFRSLFIFIHISYAISWFFFGDICKVVPLKEDKNAFRTRVCTQKSHNWCKIILFFLLLLLIFIVMTIQNYYPSLERWNYISVTLFKIIQKVTSFFAQENIKM